MERSDIRDGLTRISLRSIRATSKPRVSRPGSGPGHEGIVVVLSYLPAKIALVAERLHRFQHSLEIRTDVFRLRVDLVRRLETAFHDRLASGVHLRTAG